ncbi:MAG: MmcB family DNA repair protein [Kiloniellales bacterium]
MTDSSPHLIADRLAGASPRAAAMLTRGLCRALLDRGYAPLTEFNLKSGRRADVIAVDKAGQVLIAEIKSSVEDYRADRKWMDYLAWCDRFYFCVPAGFDTALLPDSCGLILADGYGAEFCREPQATPLAPSRRRALVLRFARTSAGRLQRLVDP